MHDPEIRIPNFLSSAAARTFNVPALTLRAVDD